MQKIKTGIPGLDEILKGGLNQNSSVLITGAPGTGKSIMALQFAYYGAQKGEPSLYLTSEETAVTLRSYAKSLGMDLEPLEKKGTLTIVEQPITGKIISIEAPLTVIRKKKIKRVALDSLTLFQYAYGSDQYEFRKGILSFLSDMKNEGITLFVTSERSTMDIDNFAYKPQDFIFEGLIILSKIRKSQSFERVLTVAKVRGQDHLLDIFPFQITSEGVKVFPKQLPFSLIEQDVRKVKK